MKKNYIGKIFSLESFEVNDGNVQAYSAIKNIVDKERKIYNPLFIYGDHGLGKTHLLKALIAENSKLKCKYITVDNFLNTFTEHMQFQTMDLFRKEFLELDILCIDDFESIVNKSATQEELLNVITNLMNLDKVIVFSSSKSYTELSLLEKLSSVIQHGEVVEIKNS